MDARLTQAEASYLHPFPATLAMERARALRIASASAYQAELLRGAVRLLARVGDALVGWIRRGRIRAELAALTDRELLDIGLTRGDFDRVLAVEPVPASRPAPQRAGARIARPA